MIWAQAVWGAILAGLLGFTFHRAWRWEHGVGSDAPFAERHGKETFVFAPPTVLFWILLTFLVLFLLWFGLREGCLRFAALTADVMLILCVYFVLLLALLPLLRRWVSARACAVLWLVPAFLVWQGGTLIRTLPMPRRTVYIPRGALPVIGGVWLAGFCAVGGYYLISHLRFRARVWRSAHPERDGAVLALWDSEREALEYRRPVALLRANVPAPFSMGQTKRSRCTVLPERGYAPEELKLIFRHELHHLQRCDVDTKAFLCLCSAFCWFNPLVWIAVKKAAEDLERSCDEIVVEDMGEEERKRYARLLLDAAAPGGGCTTCLSAAAGTLRYRLKSIVDRRPRLRGTLLLMAALFACVMGFGAVSFTDARGSFTELLLPEGTEIASVLAPQLPDDGRWDDARLRDALSAVELEHVAGLRNPATGGWRVSFRLYSDHYTTVMLTDRLLTVFDARHFRSTTDCYLVRGGVDWDAIYAAFG